MRVYEMENNETEGGENENGEELGRFSVLYAKASTRKHKKWEADGVLICFAKVALMKSEDESTVVTRSTSIKRLDDLEDGKIIFMGGWEVQIQERIEKPSRQAPARSIGQKVVGQNVPRPVAATVRATPPAAPKPSFQSTPRPAGGNKRQLPMGMQSAPAVKKVLSSSNAAASRGFVCPVVGLSAQDPKMPPFVLNQDEVSTGSPPVVADPLFARFLRDHQKDGVRFIFERLRKEGNGVILADEMGLGKSIQTITATWALLKRQGNPGCGLSKCLIVVPSSLVNNWKAEFKKWFRVTRSPVMVVTQARAIESYRNSFNYNPYMVISYDMALRYADKLAAVRFDLLVCDEGHRLKNIKGKLREALVSLSIGRRLLLTGTPLQNDIDEFFSLLDFVRPDKFGTMAEFRAQCSGDAETPASFTNSIDDTMLRRTSEVNNAHLPQKHEYVLFCRPSPVQRRVLSSLCEHMTGDPLVLIDLMRKLANHPAILYKKLATSERESSFLTYQSLLGAFPKNYGNCPATLADSGKLSVLLDMLASFRLLEECAVVVSNYTKTLDMLAGLCSSIGLRVFRLDGSIPVADRQKLVTAFNQERDANNVFLLSTKAGGVGLNLIAASRLVVFDSDWNPANDLQAMARIWRDGQTRPCHIYRLATAGMIDEKILQRQIKKTGLGAVIDTSDMSGVGNVKFRDEDLMDIFRSEKTECSTHEMLECECGGNGLLPNEKEEEENEDESGEVTEEGTVDQRDLENSAKSNENSEVVTAEETEEEENGPASMAELFRWRHFSPNCPSAWSLFVSQAGFLPDSVPTELTFAFQLSSKF